MKDNNVANNQQVDALEEKLVQVNRVAKVVKGGRISSEIFGRSKYLYSLKFIGYLKNLPSQRKY